MDKSETALERYARKCASNFAAMPEKAARTAWLGLMRDIQGVAEHEGMQIRYTVMAVKPEAVFEVGDREDMRDDISKFALTLLGLARLRQLGYSFALIEPKKGTDDDR